MADGDDRSLEILQRLLQHLAAVHVEMVGRLVQQQHVVLSQHQLRQRHPALLASAEGGNGAEHLVSRKQELSQRTPYLVLLQPPEFVPDLIQHGFAVIQPGLMLVVVADIHAGSPADDPRVRLFLRDQAFEQRGFPGAVVSDQGDSLPGPHVHPQIRKQRPALITLSKPLGDQHILSGPPAGFEAEVDFPLLRGFFEPLHLLQPLLPAFRRPDALLPVKPAVGRDNGLLPGDFLLLQLPGLHPDLVDGGPLLQIFGIVSRIGLDVSRQQLRHPAAYPVQEVPVMADHQHGAPEILKVFLEPGDALQVQMVGRLVEQQQIRPGQQHPAQAEPRPLAAGKNPGGLVLVFPQVQPGQHPLHLAAPSVSVSFLKGPGQAVILSSQPAKQLLVSRGLRHPGLGLPHFLFKGDDRVKHALQRPQHGFLSAELPLLRQIADAKALLNAHASLVRVFQPGDDFHQGAFPAAVHPDQAHLLPVLQGQGRVPEHLVGSEALPDSLQSQDNHSVQPPSET